MDTPTKRRWGCLPWGIVFVGTVFIPEFNASCSRGNQMIGVVNCNQIILSLKQYAKDAGSSYPDGKRFEFKSVNQVFRELFKEEIVTDERIFGCRQSWFMPDNDLGKAPDFEKTLSPGECHWMLLKHQTDLSHPKTPVVIENALNATWPPKWDAPHSLFAPWSGRGLKKTRGRSWAGGKIIIARNDGSVAVEKLRHDGTLDWHSPSNLDEHGKSWIDYLTPAQVAKLEYWDIEEK